MRVKKTFTVSTLEWAFVAEARNLLAWQNVIALFAETGSTANNVFRDGIVSAEMTSLDAEATGNGALAGDGTVTLPGDCSAWTGPGASGPMNCVALKRVEARFGNGDGLYTLPERLAALHGFYNAFSGAQRFAGAGRTVRLGIEIHW